jgi:ferredoxin
LRIGVAWVVGCLFTALFVGPPVISGILASTLPRTQAVPALLCSIEAGSLAAVVVLAVIALSALVFGRVYCAAWCPLGVLQDAVRYLARRLPPLRRWQDRPAKIRRPRRRLVIRWAILAASVAVALAGAGGLAAVLEPYSAFGRIVSQVTAPVLHAGLGGLATLLERIDVYALTVPSLPATPLLVLLCAGVYLLVLVAMAVFGSRLYCSTICPVGTCLGLLAQAAPVRIRFDATACSNCGLCIRGCRATCIRSDGGTIEVDQAACVACMDCVAVCPNGGIRYGLPGRAAGAAGPVASSGSAGRRELLAAGSAAALTALVRPLRRFAAAPGPEAAEGGPVSPPGSQSRDHFTQRCTACQLCVSVCPTRVLKPALFEYGAAGVLQPRLSFQDAFCEYDCNRCTAVCPNGALHALSLEAKQRTQLGLARLHKERCIVYCRGEDCGACAEVCPTHAVHTQERDGVLYPEMAQGACIGCGACEFACPEAPKAIEVLASAVHGRAAPPYVPEAPGGASTLPADAQAPGFPF